MEVSARRNCGYPGISPEDCAARKCCFSDTIPQVPWCFFPQSVQGKRTVAGPPPGSRTRRASQGRRELGRSWAALRA